MEKFKELSLEEMQEVNGGGIWAGIAVGLAIAGAVIYCYNNYPSMVNGFKDGLSGTYNPPAC